MGPGAGAGRDAPPGFRVAAVAGAAVGAGDVAASRGRGRHIVSSRGRSWASEEARVRARRAGLEVGLEHEQAGRDGGGGRGRDDEPATVGQPQARAGADGGGDLCGGAVPLVAALRRRRAEHHADDALAAHDVDGAPARVVEDVVGVGAARDAGHEPAGVRAEDEEARRAARDEEEAAAVLVERHGEVVAAAVQPREVNRLAGLAVDGAHHLAFSEAYKDARACRLELQPLGVGLELDIERDAFAGGDVDGVKLSPSPKPT